MFSIDVTFSCITEVLIPIFGALNLSINPCNPKGYLTHNKTQGGPYMKHDIHFSFQTLVFFYVGHYSRGKSQKVGLYLLYFSHIFEPIFLERGACLIKNSRQAPSQIVGSLQITRKVYAHHKGVFIWARSF